MLVTLSHVVIYAKNTSGASISKGTPVYITGTVGATDTVQIAPANASDSAKMPAVGLLDDTLANNAFGYVITGGFMDNITTDPIDGATPNSNDTVYVKAGGGLTLTKPTGASNLIQNVAKVGKVSGGNSGSLIVSSILRTNDVPNLTTGKIWVGSAANTIESATVYLDEANTRMGIGTSSPSQKLHVHDSSSTNLKITSTSSGTGLFDGLNLAIANGFSQLWYYENGYFRIATNNTERMRITSSGNVGIGTTSPDYKLEVDGTLGVSRTDGIIFAGSAGTGNGNKITSDTSNNFIFSTSLASLPYTTSERMRITNSGNVGIGTTSPDDKLDVNGRVLAKAFRTYVTSSDYSVISRSSAGNAPLYVQSADSATNQPIAKFFYGNASPNQGSLVLNVGKDKSYFTNTSVGIGTTSPGSILHVKDSAPVIKLQSSANTSSTISFDNSSGTQRASLSFNESTDGFGLRNLTATGNLLFTGASGQGEFTTGSFSQSGVVINYQSLALKSNYSTVLYANGLAQVGIGTTSPNAKLDVAGSALIGASHSTTSIGATSFACGDGNTISGESSFAANHLTEATGDLSAAFGYDTTASGGASFSIGALTTASGGNSFASGGGSTASGGESAAFGYQTTASGEESFAIGNGTTASGASSFAGGGPTTLASAPNAFAFGADVDVTGGHSAAFGRLHDVAGTENLVGGLSNVVNGAANLVGGASNDLGSKTNNLVAGGSHTMTTDAGNYNTIIGFNNEIGFGSYNLSGGQETFNFGTRSISFGSGTTASKGSQQFAFGEGTTTPTTATAARASNQFVVGKFNDINNAVLFAVGNGTSTSFRQNALTVSTSGYVGISTASPVYNLDVNGLSIFRNTLFYTTLTQISQRDQKKDIADIDKTKARAIPFKEYKYKSSVDGSERKRYGVVVEDIEDDYPELVYTGSDGVKGVSYIDLLIKRVAELEKELEDISLTPGPKGNTGATGATGPAGANGTNGKDGANGNDHLKNVQSITFNEKSGQLEITIEGYKEPFRFNPAK